MFLPTVRRGVGYKKNHIIFLKASVICSNTSFLFNMTKVLWFLIFFNVMVLKVTTKIISVTVSDFDKNHNNNEKLNYGLLRDRFFIFFFSFFKFYNLFLVLKIDKKRRTLLIKIIKPTKLLIFLWLNSERIVSVLFAKLYI